MTTTKEIIHNGKELYPNLTIEEYMKIEWVEIKDLKLMLRFYKIIGQANHDILIEEISKFEGCEDE